MVRAHPEEIIFFFHFFFGRLRSSYFSLGDLLDNPCGGALRSGARGR